MKEYFSYLLKNRQKVKLQLAKHIADAIFGEIWRQLFYKKDLYGNVIHVIDGLYPSSKTCSCCGTIKSDLTLVDRTYICETCGLSIDRDVNAAINLDKVGRAHPEPTDACGPVCVRTRTGRHDGAVSFFQENEATSMEEAGSESVDE